MAKDDDLLPKKRTKPATPASKRSSAGPSRQMRRLMLGTRVVGILLGGGVTLVAMMSVVGLATDNVWVRLLVGLVIVVGLPAFLADRLLKRTSLGGGLAMVGDVFAIVLLGVALVLVAADVVSRPLFTKEGDRYARAGSTGMARLSYFLAGVSPTFPSEKAPKAAASGSASASAAASASGGK